MSIRILLSVSCMIACSILSGCSDTVDKSTVESAPPPPAGAKPAAKAPEGKQNGFPGLSPEGGSKAPIGGEGGISTATEMKQ